MRTSLFVVATLLLIACAAPDEKDGRRDETAITDFIEINELVSVDAIRTREQLVARRVNDTYYIVSTRKQDYLLEYYSRCMRRYDGSIEPDKRQDARALYPRIDTFRGCRIKAIYAIEPAQVDELREIGKSVGG
jgi:hypothetical protein